MIFFQPLLALLFLLFFGFFSKWVEFLLVEKQCIRQWLMVFYCSNGFGFCF
jgi:hypothetical protein